MVLCIPFYHMHKSRCPNWPNLKVQRYMPKGICCKALIPATCIGFGIILFLEIPKATKVGRGRILVDAPVSTGALLIRDAPVKAVTYKGLSSSTTRLTRSLLEKVSESFAS